MWSLNPSVSPCVSTQNLPTKWNDGWQVTMSFMKARHIDFPHSLWKAKAGQKQVGKTWQTLRIPLNFALWGWLIYHTLLCYVSIVTPDQSHLMSSHCMESGVDAFVSWPIIFGPRKHWELGKILVLGAKYWLGPAGWVGWWRVLRGHNDSIGGESQKSWSSSIYYIARALLLDGC